MSDETVIEADGIRVTKSFDAEGFPVPAVRFDVTSTRSDETMLTITDEIPGEFDIDQIGFHPEYGSEHWTATGDGVVRFERPVEANEEFTTVYGVRMGDDEEPSAFLDAPTVTVGDETSATGIEDVVPPESSDIVRELAGGKRDTIPGLEDETTATADTEDEVDGDAEAVSAEAAESSPQAEKPANEPLLDALHEDDEIVDAEAAEPAVAASTDTNSDVETPADEPTVAEVATSSTADSTAETDVDPVEESTDESPAETTHSSPDREPMTDDTAEPTSTEAVAAADVAAALADQIRNDEIADEDLSVLRTELAPKRSNVQLEHLQSRVSEMEAYADALGAFIDENGDARGLLEDLQSDVKAMENDVASLEDTLDSAGSERDAIRDSVADVEAKLDGLDDVEERIDRVTGDLDALDERVEGVEETASEVEALTEDLEALQDELNELEEWRDQLSDVFGA